MKFKIILGGFILVASQIGAQPEPRTARDYYNEIYAAGGLDRMADDHVCFDEDPTNQNFFIFGQSKFIREVMMAEGTFAKLPKATQARLQKDFLIVRGYARGIPFDNEEYYDKDGASWVSGKYPLGNGKAGLIQIRLTINWQTLRYKRAVEMFDTDSSYRGELAHFGKCEEVKTDVRQRGE